jgi:hypothetical protein
MPRAMPEMYKSGISDKTERVMTAMLQMKKLDIGALKKAYDGVPR